jgi:hypothetical protein
VLSGEATNINFIVFGLTRPIILLGGLFPWKEYVFYACILFIIKKNIPGTFL